MNENNSVAPAPAAAPMLVCGNSISSWCVKPDDDMTWNRDDWGRAQSFEIRFHRMGVNEAERRVLIPAAVWCTKHPGMRFHDDIMKRLEELMFH